MERAGALDNSRASTRRNDHGHQTVELGDTLDGMRFRLAFLLLSSLASAQQVDLLLRGGQVIDGSGSDARAADVGIRGDRIVLIGDGSKAQAKRTLDVKGLVVSPG